MNAPSKNRQPAQQPGSCTIPPLLRRSPRRWGLGRLWLQERKSEIAIRLLIHQKQLHLHFTTTMRINRQMVHHLQPNWVERWINIPRWSKKTDRAVPARAPDRLHLSDADGIAMKTVNWKSPPVPPLFMLLRLFLHPESLCLTKEISVSLEKY